MWLSDRSQAAANFVKHYLLTHPATAGNDITGNPITVAGSGLTSRVRRRRRGGVLRRASGRPAPPDIIGIVQHGVVYTGGKAKIAEHGGDDRQDRNVPILVVLPGLQHGQASATPVETTQIAPTILRCSA